MNRRELLRALSVAIGGGMSASILSSVVAKAEGHHAHMQEESVGSEAVPYEFQTLDAQQQVIISGISDIIIPRTSSPGAADVGVPAFIDLMLSEWYDKADTSQYLQGVKLFQNATFERAGGDFISLSAEQKFTLVKQLDQAVFGGRSLDAALSHFYLTTKELTIIGFYTSLGGMEEELMFDGPIGEGSFEPSGPPGSFTRY